MAVLPPLRGCSLPSARWLRAADGPEEPALIPAATVVRGDASGAFMPVWCHIYALLFTSGDVQKPSTFTLKSIIL